MFERINRVYKQYEIASPRRERETLAIGDMMLRLEGYHQVSP